MLNRDLAFVFCHGWGFDRNYWKNLLNFFKDYKTLVWDLGYFDQEEISLPQDQYKLIGIGHSFGFKKLLEKQECFDALIGIQAFTSFLGYSPDLCKKRIIEAKRFKKNFTNCPEKTLKQFYLSTGLEYTEDLIKSAKIDKLSSDLDNLIQEIDLPQQATLIIGSKNDSVVPEEILIDNFKEHNQIQMAMHDNAKHGLGYLEPEYVYQQITDFIHGLRF